MILTSCASFSQTANTFFSAASDYLNSVAKLGKNFDAKDRSLLASVLSFVSDIINGKLDNAKKENEFVFHEKVRKTMSWDSY